MSIVAVSSSFDDLSSRHVRFLEEAAKLGDVHALLWSDAAVEAIEGRPAKFPEHERHYFVQAIRYVRSTSIIDGPIRRDALPSLTGVHPDIWAVDQASASPGKRDFCKLHRIDYRVIADEQFRVFPASVAANGNESSICKKVIVTGCYDWLHTGHVRFFEEVAEYGDLYVCLGHDANIAMLKGAGHPQFRQDERRYMVQSIRYVKQALISSGDGWLDAEPEIRRLRPDIYAVNEDGDRPEKRAYCEKNGIEYLVLKRLPKPGLPRRQSTALRGF